MKMQTAPIPWPSVEKITQAAPLPSGYSYVWMARRHIQPLIKNISRWYPDVRVGSASEFLREDFYLEKVSLDGEAIKDTFIFLISYKNEIVTMGCAERDMLTLSFYAGLAVVSPEHRDSGIGRCFTRIPEFSAREMGLEYIYLLATLKIPHVQALYEKLGFTLIGFVPGYDREEISPGVAKRVVEAAYAKVLVPKEQMLWPDVKNMTPRTQALFLHLFPDGPPI